MNKDTRPLMVSIHCTTYNHEPYIRQCLDGFVMQKTNFRFEAVVHDDASTDGTTAIVKEYAKKYPDIIKPIFETENQFSKHDGSLRRIMAARIYGKYVAYCEGDDYWIDPLKLQKQVDFLETHPDYSMCFHRAQIKNEIGKKRTLILCEEIEDREYNPNELYEKWVVPTASICSKREAIYVDNIGTERIMYGDIICILNCAKIGKIWGMSDTMSVYRIQATGLTNDKSKKKSTALKSINHYKFIKDNYPFIKESISNKKISSAYFDRRHYQTTCYEYVKDIIYACYYYPFVLVDKVKCKIFSNRAI